MECGGDPAEHVCCQDDSLQDHDGVGGGDLSRTDQGL